jgi:hypothetical protein
MGTVSFGRVEDGRKQRLLERLERGLELTEMAWLARRNGVLLFQTDAMEIGFHMEKLAGKGAFKLEAAQAGEISEKHSTVARNILARI